MVDAHSKWPEVIDPMKTTTAESTANALRSIFARYGLPTQVVSDNGPPFSSAEYGEFLQQNGVQRVLVSPYHPYSNGLAERFVQTFKHALIHQPRILLALYSKGYRTSYYLIAAHHTPPLELHHPSFSCSESYEQGCHSLSQTSVVMWLHSKAR